MAGKEMELGMADRIMRAKESFRVGVRVELEEGHWGGPDQLRTKPISSSLYTAELYGAKPPGSGTSSAPISPQPPPSSSPLGRPIRPSIFREASGSGAASSSNQHGGNMNQGTSPTKADIAADAAADELFKQQRMEYQRLQRQEKAEQRAGNDATDANSGSRRSSTSGRVSLNGGTSVGSDAVAAALAHTLDLTHASTSNTQVDTGPNSEGRPSPGPPPNSSQPAAAPQAPSAADTEPPSHASLLARLDRRYSATGTTTTTSSPTSSHASGPRAPGHPTSGPGHTTTSLGGGVLSQDPLPHQALRAKRTSLTGSHPASPHTHPSAAGATATGTIPAGGGGLFSVMLSAASSPQASPMRSPSPSTPTHTGTPRTSAVRTSLLARSSASEGGGILALHAPSSTQPDGERGSTGRASPSSAAAAPSWAVAVGGGGGEEEQGDVCASVERSSRSGTAAASPAALTRSGSRRGTASAGGNAGGVGPGATPTPMMGGNLGLALGAAFSRPGVIAGALARSSSRRQA